MAISSYSELQDAVGNWLARSEFSDGGGSATRTEEFIVLAEAEFNRTLRTQEMEARSSASVSTEYVALPSDFLELRAVWIDDTRLYQLEYMSPAHLVDVRASDETSRPEVYSIIGEQLRLRPAPDKAYTVIIDYWEEIPALSDANTSNWLLSAHPDAYLFGSLLQASLYIDMEDAKVARWKIGFDQAIRGIRKLDRRKQFPTGGGMQARPDVGVL